MWTIYKKRRRRPTGRKLKPRQKDASYVDWRAKAGIQRGCTKVVVAPTLKCHDDVTYDEEGNYKDRLPILRVRLAGQEMDGLLDTGASSSIIDGHTARMLMRSGHVLHHDSNIVFIMAAGRTKGTGYIRANISWGPDHSMDHTFLVLEDCADSLLLGRDFMFHSGITPCIRKHGYYIETDEDQDKKWNC